MGVGRVRVGRHVLPERRQRRTVQSCESGRQGRSRSGRRRRRRACIALRRSEKRVVDLDGWHLGVVVIVGGRGQQRRVFFLLPPGRKERSKALDGHGRSSSSKS